VHTTADRPGASATAGFRTATLPDDASGATVPLLVLYPSAAPERPERLGPYELGVAAGAAVAAGRFPLVVVSHGSGGSPLVYRTLAAALARAGFVVVLPEHPRNNRNDNSLAGTHTILADRPRQLRLAADWAYADAALGPHLRPDSVAVVGHSLGGYAALAVAGGAPTAGPRDTPDGRVRPVPVVPDPRVRALVLLAPATPWLMAPGALRNVRAPVLLWTAGHDVHTPPWHGEIVTHGLPAGVPVDARCVADGGHFAFLTPFPAAMTSPGFPPSQDPPGFDRAAFHEVLNAEIPAFLRRAL
jgi:predicted dienelactone hydrolase